MAGDVPATVSAEAARSRTRRAARPTRPSWSTSALPIRAWWCGCHRWSRPSRTTSSDRRHWSRTPLPRRCAGTGTGGGRDRSRVDRLAVSGHAPRGGRHPGPARSSTPTCATPGRPSSASCTTSSSTSWPTCMPSTGRRRPGRGVPGGNSRTVERWVAYVAWSSEGDPLPALEQALDWCGRHVPAERPPCCCGATSAWATSSSMPSAASPRCSIGTWPPSAPRDGPRLALRPRVHDGGAVRRRLPDFPVGGGPGALPSSAPGTRCGTWPGTRCSRWCGPSPSTTATSASPVTGAGARTRWATFCWRAWSPPPGRTRQRAAAGEEEEGVRRHAGRGECVGRQEGGRER